MGEVIVFLVSYLLAGLVVGLLVGLIITSIANYWFVHNYVCHGCQDPNRKMTHHEYVRGGGVHQGCKWRRA